MGVKSKELKFSVPLSATQIESWLHYSLEKTPIKANNITVLRKAERMFSVANVTLDVNGKEFRLGRWNVEVSVFETSVSSCDVVLTAIGDSNMSIMSAVFESRGLRDGGEAIKELVLLKSSIKKAEQIKKILLEGLN